MNANDLEQSRVMREIEDQMILASFHLCAFFDTVTVKLRRANAPRLYVSQLGEVLIKNCTSDAAGTQIDTHTLIWNLLILNRYTLNFEIPI